MQSITAMMSSDRWRTGAAALTGGCALWLLCALLAFLCLVAAVRLALLLATPTPLPTVALPAAQAQSGRQYSLYPGAAAPLEGGGENLAVARINAVVAGVVSRPEGAWVSISLDGKTDSLYTVGDKLAPSVVIEAIAPAGVVVREQGVLRRIPLRSLLVDGSATLHASASAPSALGDDVASDLTPGLIDKVAVTQVINGDGSTGFRLGPMDAQAAALGLNEGDLVMAINGRPLAELVADSQALAALGEEAQLAVTLVRDGSELDVTIDGAVISQWLVQQAGL